MFLEYRKVKRGWRMAPSWCNQNGPRYEPQLCSSRNVIFVSPHEGVHVLSLKQTHRKVMYKMPVI